MAEDSEADGRTQAAQPPVWQTTDTWGLEPAYKTPDATD